jgi:dipeptidyl aminopeptidase/acylaminoacyl peptidase
MRGLSFGVTLLSIAREHPTRMQEHFHAAGKPIRILVHEPASTEKVPAIVLLHGAGGNAAYWFDRLAPLLTHAQVALYAPLYFDTTGTKHADLATITDGIHFPQWLETVDAAMKFAASRSAVDATRLALLGTSLGGFLALAFAAQLSASPDPAERHRIRCLVELSGGMPEPWRSMAGPDFPPAFLAHGELDDIVPAAYAHDADARLRELNVPHQTHILPGEAHWFSNEAQLQLLLAAGEFLTSHLKP